MFYSLGELQLWVFGCSEPNIGGDTAKTVDFGLFLPHFRLCTPFRTTLGDPLVGGYLDEQPVKLVVRSSTFPEQNTRAILVVITGPKRLEARFFLHFMWFSGILGCF